MYIPILEILDAIKNIPFLFGYVTNASSFPQPLNQEDEQKYLELYKNGDEEARNILIERNLRLVAHIVKKYATSINDSDDLISIGTIGLIKGISTFDNTKGTRLATYAARCIENAIPSLRKHLVTHIATRCLKISLICQLWVEELNIIEYLMV